MSATDLYHDAIMALARSGAGGQRLDAAHQTVTLDNPLCGDRITLDINMIDGRVAAIGHKVRGCVLCEAAAAVVSQHALGASGIDLAAVHDWLKSHLNQGPQGQDTARDGWPELAAFAPVHGHKSRYECVLLPFEAAVEATKK